MKEEAKVATATIVYVLLAIAVISALTWAWRYYTAETRGVVNAEVKIESAESRIGNYEHFYDMCAAIQGYEGAVAVQKELLPTLTGKDHERVSVVISGISAQRARLISQYNADARKSYTKARFIASDLPHQIDLKSENTVCN